MANDILNIMIDSLGEIKGKGFMINYLKGIKLASIHFLHYAKIIKFATYLQALWRFRAEILYLEAKE